MALVTAATLGAKYVLPALANTITSHILSGGVESEFDKPPSGPPGMPSRLFPTSGGVCPEPTSGGMCPEPTSGSLNPMNRKDTHETRQLRHPFLEEDQMFAPSRVRAQLLQRPIVAEQYY